MTFLSRARHDRKHLPRLPRRNGRFRRRWRGVWFARSRGAALASTNLRIGPCASFIGETPMIRRAAFVVLAIALSPALVHAQEMAMTVNVPSAEVHKGPSTVTPVIGHAA